MESKDKGKKKGGGGLIMVNFMDLSKSETILCNQLLISRTYSIVPEFKFWNLFSILIIFMNCRHFATNIAAKEI